MMETVGVMREAPKELKDRVIHLRAKRGVTQNGLAKKLGVKQGHISDVENGRRGVSLDLLGRLAQALETTSDYLLGITDNEETPGTPEDYAGVLVKNEERREQIQNLCDIAKDLNDYDLLLLLQVARRSRMASEGAEYYAFWELVRQVSGREGVELMIRRIGHAPDFIKRWLNKSVDDDLSK